MKMMKREDHPISRIEWLPVETLTANDWNPNHVMPTEMKLLKQSMLGGWVQPVLVARTAPGSYRVIDGFHRTTLVKTDKDVAALTDSFVPCAVLDITEAEAMLMTVRINRAKGSHNAFRMHELVSRLHKDHGKSIGDIAKGIGASKHEIETLLLENVFQALNVDALPYSRAWTPKTA
jgi:ParB-like chromosome segregation protein Spo0J